MTDRPPDVHEDEINLLVSGAEALGAEAAVPCPEANALAELADGCIATGARAAIETHLSRCPPCRTIVAALTALGAAGVSQASSSARGAGAEGAGSAGARADFPRAFGSYSLLRRIGGGGMGEVFEAEHVDRHRREALKQLRAGLDDDLRASERFLREVRAAARVVHDHVVALYDSGVIDGVLYYTMPLLPGPSLGELVEELRETGEATPARAANAVLDGHGIPAAPLASGDPERGYARRVAARLSPVAAALAAIHDVAMVHRDVKPSNLVLDERRRAVLTDFGLVRIDASRMTQASETLGTPAYMAPEQLEPGAAVDGRADVYALGVSLYELATLHRPYEGGSLAETVALILRGKPRAARERNPGLPRDLDVLIARCLERRPADRYADARALARDLDAFARGEPITARPMSAPARLARAIARYRIPVAIAATALVALGALAYVFPGSLNVRATPSAELALDGEDVGVTPLANRSVSAGNHRIELRREKFAPTVRSIDIGRGATYDLDVVLRALDPADPETLLLLGSELGVKRAEVSVALDRTPSRAADMAVLFPRGALREAPAEISIWTESPVAAVKVELRRMGAAAATGTDEIMHSWELADTFRQVRLAVSGDVRSTLGPDSYRLDIAGGGKRGMQAAFEVLSDADARLILREIDASTRGFAPDDLAARFLRADLLIARGLYVDALAEATRLRQSLGDRREVGRLVLASLDRAGLRDIGPWFDWAALYLRAEK